MVFENFNLEQCEDSKSIGNLTIAINLVTACIEAHLLRSSRQERVSKIYRVFAHLRLISKFLPKYAKTL